MWCCEHTGGLVVTGCTRMPRFIHLYRFASQKLHKPTQMINNRKRQPQRKRGISSVHKLLPYRGKIFDYIQKQVHSHSRPVIAPNAFCGMKERFNARLVSITSRSIASDVSPIPRNSPQICERYCLISKAVSCETSTKKEVRGSPLPRYSAQPQSMGEL